MFHLPKLEYPYNGLEPHIDRKGRVDEQFCLGCSSSSNDSHGDHVSGTIMGAGNLDSLS